MMGKQMLTRIILAALTLTGGIASQAALVDGSGAITGWGFTPFNNTGSYGNWSNGAPPLASGIDGVDSGATGSASWTEGNNAAPIDYPNSPDYVPAPANTNSGEAFDSEFLGWRLINGGTQVQILGITSINPTTGATHNGRTFHVGDVFMDVDGNDATGIQGGYDVAASVGNYSSNLNDPLHPGDDNPTWNHNLGNDLYALDSTDDYRHVTDEGGFGAFPALAGPNNPWAIRTGATSLGATTFEADTFDYGTVFGANENGTWILQWTFDVALLGPNFDPYRMQLHWGTECGNDFSDVGPVVPEPATLAMVGLGLASAGLFRRRQRRA